jgi:hypothetical protein
MKQTAVEWLVEKLYGDNQIFGVSVDLLNQALEMEKEQIVEAYNQGSLDTYKKEPKNGQGTKYYNETFKK